MLKKGSLYVLACYVLWGTLPGYWKLLAPASSLYVLSCRVVCSLVLMWIILAAQKKLGGIKAVMQDRREWGRLAIAGVLICINWGVFIWAVSAGRILDSSLAYYMNPIFAILLGTLVFREKMSKLQWLSVAVTFTGLVIAVVRYGQVPWAALTIAASFALYGAVKKGVRVDAGTSLFMETLTLAPFALAFMIGAELGGRGAVGVVAPWQYPLLVFSGVVTSVPLLCFSVGIRTTSMTTAGILMYINPTLQLLTGIFFYGETFTTTHAILFGFVWTGLALYLISDMLQHRKRKEEKNKCE